MPRHPATESRDLPLVPTPFTPPPRPPFDRIIRASDLTLEVLPRLAEAAACLPWRYRVFVASDGPADLVDLKRLAVAASLVPEAWFFATGDGAGGPAGGSGESLFPAGSPALRLPANLWLGLRCNDTPTAAAALAALADATPPAGFPPSRRFLVIAPGTEPVRLPTSPAGSPLAAAVQWIICVDRDPPCTWAERRANWIAVQCREAGVPFYYAGSWGPLQRAVGVGACDTETHPAELRRRHLVGAVDGGSSGLPAAREPASIPPAPPWRPTKWFEFPAELDG